MSHRLFGSLVPAVLFLVFTATTSRAEPLYGYEDAYGIVP